MSTRNPHPEVRFLTTREAAAFLGVDERTLRRYIASDLPHYRRLPDGPYRVSDEAIVDLWGRSDDAR